MVWVPGCEGELRRIIGHTCCWISIHGNSSSRAACASDREAAKKRGLHARTMVKSEAAKDGRWVLEGRMVREKQWIGWAKKHERSQLNSNRFQDTIGLVLLKIDDRK